jgi:L-fuconolactonase
MKIDAHQHFWRYSAAEYGWIDDNMRAIRADFLPETLAPILTANGIDGTVAVQARQTLEETNWLLDLATRHSLIKGVVGWVPLSDPNVADILATFAERPHFKGVRHVVQGESDPEFLERAAFNHGIRAVTKLGLVYDLLIFARQLRAAIKFVDLHTTQVFVLDHIAKPVVQGLPPADWRRDIRELARRENVACKFSGLVTEVPGWKWTPELLRPYFEVVLEAFGPRRLMVGSDWPVCLVASDYGRWFEFVESCTALLSSKERARVLGGTAIDFYKI